MLTLKCCSSQVFSSVYKTWTSCYYRCVTTCWRSRPPLLTRSYTPLGPAQEHCSQSLYPVIQTIPPWFSLSFAVRNVMTAPSAAARCWQEISGQQAEHSERCREENSLEIIHRWCDSVFQDNPVSMLAWNCVKNLHKLWVSETFCLESVVRSVWFLHILLCK